VARGWEGRCEPVLRAKSETVRVRGCVVDYTVLHLRQSIRRARVVFDVMSRLSFFQAITVLARLCGASQGVCIPSLPASCSHAWKVHVRSARLRGCTCRRD